MIGNRQQFGRLFNFLIRRVPFATDREQQWMYACGVDRLHLLHARNLQFNGIPRQLMDQFTERRVLLWRSAYYRKWPNGIRLGVHFVYLHHWERMNQAVIT
ncbi:hypothetical protein D3C77_550780 [compost metagenome]